MAKISGQNGKVFLHTSVAVTGATGTTTITVTTGTAHGLSLGSQVLIESVVGMTDINGLHIVTEIVDGSEFKIVIALTGQSYSSGGTVQETIAITSWTLDIASEAIQTTDSSVSTWHTFIDSEFKGGSGTFEAFFVTGALDTLLGNSTVLILEADSANYYTCTAFITGNSSTVDVPGAEAVKKSYTFTNTSTITLTAA